MLGEENIEFVSSDERFSRWVYCPRHIGNDGVLNERFIYLRPSINEEGISGQLYDRISFEIAVDDGKQFLRKRNNGDSEKMVAIAVVKTGELRGLSYNDDSIDVVSQPSERVHYHAEIRISFDGNPVTGNTPGLKTKFYFDRIKQLMQANLVPVVE